MKNTQILESLNAISAEDFVVEDSVYIENIDAHARKYEHCEGYFYSYAGSDWWIADVYDFDIDDEDGSFAMPNEVWLKNRN